MYKTTLVSICLTILLCVTLSADAQLLRGIFGWDDGNNQGVAPNNDPVPVANYEEENNNNNYGEENNNIAPIVPVDARAPPNANWYIVDQAQGQNPKNLMARGNDFSMQVGPGEEAVKIHSKQKYTNGRFTVRAKSASVMPGIITAIYLASGEGRTNDYDLGDQDELDFEFLGNHPNEVQTNIFVNGNENLRWLPVANHANQFHEYTLEWDDNHVAFYMDNQQVRYQRLYQPLKPMNLVISVWTTTGGWPGLIQWGGATNWGYRGNRPAIAEFEVIELPN